MTILWLVQHIILAMCSTWHK